MLISIVFNLASILCYFTFNILFCLQLLPVFMFICASNLQTGGSRDSTSGIMSRVTRKHVIIAVTCAVVIAMVIAGVLIGIKFHLDSTSDIITVYLHND